MYFSVESFTTFYGKNNLTEKNPVGCDKGSLIG